ncbi:MAG: geranylgeranyl reductase family protein [Acidimicrobiia bacterium]|nr:geranylgeranyl reductase family protein [Acidimicrobiia bacterium]
MTDHSQRGNDRYDAIVVGAGPAGASAAYWLAESGRRVLVVDRKRFPREKTCGDGLTPRAVRQLHDMDLAEPLAQFHRYGGLRSIAHGMTLHLPWPAHPDFPSFGYVVRRSELDELVVGNAVKSGATFWSAAEAVAPIIDDGVVIGAAVHRKDSATTQQVRARYLVVADGASSRFGRALGTARERTYPLGMAIRGYFASPFHDEPWIESHLDVRDRDGHHLPGYGWIFPVGDGTVNVGVGLLSTFRGWKSMNTTRLMEAFCETAPARWGISPETALGAPTGGRLPTGGSVLPRRGPTWLVVGDAAGSVNPFNGEGISYAYETGRFAAEAVDLALATGDGLALGTYERRLDDEYRLYFKVARAFVSAIGNPAVMRELVRIGMHNRSLMEWVLRIMANLLRPDEIGPAEAAYKLVARLVAVGPEP